MKLDKLFVNQYANEQPDWGPVGEITFLRTYSRNGERWFETCERVVNGCYDWQAKHCKANGLPWSEVQAQHSAQQMYKLMFDMKFLPPGRGLRNMGTAVLEKTGAAANNCGFVSTADDPFDAFCWAMDMLMLGVGVGFDTLGAGTKVLVPELVSLWVLDTEWTNIIPDTREGWVGALEELFRCRRRGIPVAFDYRKIRPAGSPIVGFGGVASGPEPLRELLTGVSDILDSTTVLDSANINDIMAMIGRCVVSGGVRRSAEIAFIESDDVTGMGLKNRELYPTENNNYRWAANHSIKCTPGETDYDSILSATNGVAELGVFWLDNAKSFGRMGRRPTNADVKASGCNPCAEQTLEHKELCCLVEVFPSRIESFYEFQKVLKYAYLYAKTVTTIPIHDDTTNNIVGRNRRIGCSLTGIQQAINTNPKFYSWCSRGYKYLKQLDERYSEWMQVSKSIKITSVKPSGTVSKLPGVNSGIHFPISEAYYQVIRFASSSPYIPLLAAAGHHVHDLAPNEPNTTAVYFGVIEDDFKRCEKDVSIWEQAEHAAKMQHYWADNQVSITVKYNPDERDQIPHLLRMYEDRLKSISFFPNADHGFKHAPWQPAGPEVIMEYLDSLSPIDYNETSTTHEAEDEFCDGETCLNPNA